MSEANASPAGRSHQIMSEANASPVGRSHQLMIVAKKALPRRTFLRGMGTAVALPFLDAMVPALSAMAQTAARPVSRLGFVYIPMGSNIKQWTPAATGRITELSPSLASL